MAVAEDTPPPAAINPNAASPVLVEARGAAAGYDGAPVVEGIDLTVRAGETVAILGRSGCGKTTLLHLLAGLLVPSAGTVDAQPAALMPQRDGLMPWASARENAALPLRIAGAARRDAGDQADEQLRALGLGDALTRPVAELSGGMRQRVALARTLLSGRHLLLLDEPLAAVDALTRSELHELLLEHLARDGHGAILVTHDLDEAVLLADRVLILRSWASPMTGASDGRRPVSTSSFAGKTSSLHAGPSLSGSPGARLEHRGGDALRATLLAELGA